MKIIKKFYEMVEILKEILEELRTHNRDFQEYKYNLNQVHRRY